MKIKKQKEKTIEQYLRYIQRKGDLYDAISKKRNAIPDTCNRKLLKFHTFIFSRILYLLLVFSRRLKNSFVSVEKTKKAQDEIRKSIGLPIDIFKTKENKKELGLVYCDYDLFERGKYPDLEDLINDLKKIANFCNEYHINDIYIEKFFLVQYLSEEFLVNFTTTTQTKILKHNGSEFNYFLVKSNLKELEAIISKLEDNKYDNNFIYSLRNTLKSPKILSAIEDFQRTNDGDKLLQVVKGELLKLINEESTIKDRVYGKVHQSFELGDAFVRRTITDDSGNFISQNIITLYSLLEVINYSHLEDVAFIESEDKELKLESLLYLHLLGESLKEKREKIQIYPLYDYIYDSYKKTPSYKKIPWINTLIQKRLSEGRQYIVSILSVFLSYFLVQLGIVIPNHYLPLKTQTLDEYNNFLNKIKNAYEASYDFEQNLKKKVQQNIEKLFPQKREQEIREYYQKEIINEHKDSDNNKIGEIEWFSQEKMPLYFIDQYAKGGRLSYGDYYFSMYDPNVNFWNLVDTRPLFQIKCPISKEELDENLESEYFHLPLEACPAGNEYVLTQIYIKDETDPTRYLKIDNEWNQEHWAKLNSEDAKIIKSIQEPMLYYIYGLSSELSPQISREVSYTDISSSYAKEVILEGLNLDQDARDEEINQKIAEKEYTKTPLYNTKKDIEESDYYREIASLDAINIDYARILTTIANENSMYVTGFKNSNEDNEITLDEAYIWVINEDGEIIDFLANFTGEKGLDITTKENNWLEYEEEQKENDFISQEESEKKKQDYELTAKEIENNASSEEDNSEDDNRIKDVLEKVFTWARVHHVSYYVFCISAFYIIEKIFGKKIKFRIQLAKSHKILTDADFANTYSELFQFIYGIESSPRKREKNEMLDILIKEFYAFNEDDINSLLEEIKPIIKSDKEQTSLKKVEELLEMLPFIKENKEYIKKYKPKKLVLGGKNEK